MVSPSMLLPRHRSAARRDAPVSALHSDSWDGYLASLHRILALAYNSNSQNIVFLSGDEHIGCLATITMRKQGLTTEKILYSIHTPGLYTPYAFINSNMNDWLPETSREFVLNADTYEYTVSYTPFPGEGFVYIHTGKQGSAWRLSCQFGDGPEFNVF
jgi:cholesterol oxidase